MDNSIAIRRVRQDDQDYVTDFWDTFSKEEKDALIREGFKAPNTRCELYTIDFITLKGLVGWQYI